MLARLLAYIRGLTRRRAIDAEAGEELQFHLDREIETNRARGMSPLEARRAALADLGGLTQTIERVREVRTIGIGAVGRDVRYGLRALTATPRFTVVALLTTVLMVAGISTIYTLVHGVLLRPLPYPASDRLAIIKSTEPNGFGTNVPLDDVQAFQKYSQSFESWGLFRPGYVMSLLDARNTPVPVQDMRVTPGLFPLLGIDVVLGRSLLPADTVAGAPDVAVISYDLWQTQFAGAGDVLTRTVRTTTGGVFPIVGVTAPKSGVPTNWLPYPIVWRPVGSAHDPNLRFTTIGRLRKGVPVARANAEIARRAADLATQDPKTHHGRTASATLLLDEIVGDFKKVLWIFFGAVSCVLLIGIANLISLQVARNGARERELSLRAALGASRWQIIRQLVIESTLLCAFGGAAGLALAWPAIRLIHASLPARFPRADQIAIDAAVALFACAIALAIGIVIGIFPAWQASRVNLSARLNEGGRSATPGERRSRIQRTLIAVETAVALVLLIGAGLLANSFNRLISRDAGMRENNLWTVTATLPPRYRERAAQTAFWTSSLEQIRKLPGVESAALMVNTTAPLTGGDMFEGGVVPEGRPPSDRDGVRISARRVSADYFRTVGIQLLKGRPILESDTEGADPVVVLNELAANALWPGEDPIGKRLQSRRLRTVVGVIPTFRHSRLDGELTPQMYTSYLQQPSVASTSVIMLRATPGDKQAALAAKSVLTGMEKDLLVSVATMAQVRWKLVAAERFRAAVIGVFAANAVFLALVGVFGLVAYTIGQRQREFALRVALGAASRDIVRVAIREALSPAFVGLVAGVAGAGAATRLLTAFLVDIHPIDPPTFAAALAVLALSVVIAGLVPARQALRINPIEALRHE